MSKSERFRDRTANNARTMSIDTLDDVSAGYSGTPVAKKLGLKEGHRVTLIGAPREWSIDTLPSNVRVTRRRGAASSDVVISFFNDAASLQRDISSLAETITPDGSLWIAWPRKAAGHRSDITDNVVRNSALPLGLVDVKVAALDDDWSALKMVWRTELRATRHQLASERRTRR
jgi:hypothetical protein